MMDQRAKGGPWQTQNPNRACMTSNPSVSSTATTTTTTTCSPDRVLRVANRQNRVSGDADEEHVGPLDGRHVPVAVAALAQAARCRPVSKDGRVDAVGGAVGVLRKVGHRRW